MSRWLMLSLLTLSGCLWREATPPNASVEELVFVATEADVPEVQAAGFDGVILGGGIRRFAEPHRIQAVFDEPEDLAPEQRDSFAAWWAQYGASGLVLHWDPRKAEAAGVWRAPPAVSWNWYPVNRWTPAWLQRWYIPWQFWRFRRYLTATSGYGTVQTFAGYDERPRGQPLDYTYPSDAMLERIKAQFRVGWGRRFRGYIYFAWRWPGFPDGLADHPRQWPVHRQGGDR